MATELKVPSVGESITEVTIAKWIKTDGEFVEMDEIICELESDKATFEMNAESSGILKTKVAEGETIEVGSVIGFIEENGKPTTDNTSHSKVAEKDIQSADQQKTGEIVEMKVPSVGESITEVTISSWLKNEGDLVELDEVIAEIESDKATFELTAEASGILHQVAKEGETLEINALICKIEVVKGAIPAQKQAEKTTQEREVPVSAPAERSYAYGHPSPSAAKIMAERGIKSSDIDGSGPDGRIIKDDVLHIEPPPRQIPIEEKPSEEVIKPDKGLISRTEHRKKLSQLRKTISKRLVAVKNETAMLTTFNEVNMEPIMTLRKKYKDRFKERYEVNLGYMSFFSKACCIALHEWPSLNASLDGEEIIYHDFVDISIAVSAPKGLVVPVIRNAETLSFAEIEHEVLSLATKARENKLSIEEMTGGTFTITNGGVFGSMLSTPIINAPQSAILGMHNIVERPVVENGDILIRPVMYVALSYDHRIIDGRESVSFLVRVKELLEDPARLLLEI